MWCEQCQADVATELAVDGQSLLCTTCGQLVRKVIAPSLHPETLSAREFLDRWAREQQAFDKLTDPPTTPSQSGALPPSITAGDDAPAEIADQDLSPMSVKNIVPQLEYERDDSSPVEKLEKKKLRLDAGHGVPDGPSSGMRGGLRRPRKLQKIVASTEQPAAEASSAEPPHAPRQLRDDAEQNLARAPHFDVSRLPQSTLSGPGRAEAVWGQVLAYAGVGTLTVGTALVLWGYFGGMEQYSSTGWLVSTAGQMLLLLGIVTLVGGGMQQTTHEVSQRIEHIDGRIIRIEASTEKILKGPYYRRRRRSRSHSVETPTSDENHAA